VRRSRVARSSDICTSARVSEALSRMQMWCRNEARMNARWQQLQMQAHRRRHMTLPARELPAAQPRRPLALSHRRRYVLIKGLERCSSPGELHSAHSSALMRAPAHPRPAPPPLGRLQFKCGDLGSGIPGPQTRVLGTEGVASAEEPQGKLEAQAPSR
jgi:hypothetical protein